MEEENTQMSPKVKRTLDAFLKLLRGTKHTVKIVCGEIDPKLFEVDTFVGELEKTLRRDVRVSILFTKEASTPEEAEEKIRQENLGMLTLKETYPDLLRFYWKRDREEKHFSVADARKLVVEGSHRPYGEHDTHFFQSRSQSQKKDREFNEKIKGAVEINFTLPIDRFVGGGPKLKRTVDLEKLDARIGLR